MSIRITNAALDEYEGHVVLRGSLDPQTLNDLKVDDYQREIRPATSLAMIMKGFEVGSAVPDVELGMRGLRKNVREGVYTLLDDVYIIDGQQRVNAAKQFMAKGGTPHLGCTVHFGTTRDWERDQFIILNTSRTRVSANVILRDLRDMHDGLEAMYNLSINDPEFVLRGRVNWQQHQRREHLISAMTCCNVTLILHAHLTGTSNAGASTRVIPDRLDILAGLVGKRILRANVKTLFDVINGCWNLRGIAYTAKAPFIKSTFLLTIAKILSNHEVFWRENRLLVESDLRRKLSQFPTYDPSVQTLASTGNKVDPVLYRMIVDHLNSGKRTRRLRERQMLEDADTTDGESESDNGTADQT